MNPKRIMMIGTMAIAISIGGGTWHKTNVSPLANSLGVSSDEEIYHALYNGKSLADIAADHHKDVQSVINLQISEMAVQLSLRLARSSLTYNQYQAQKSELTEIITQSVYGLRNEG